LCIVHEHCCSPLSKLGCRHNCRQLPEKAILRNQRDVLLQFQQNLGADERTRTADLLITSDQSGVAEACTGMQIPHI
jgi:hypothetical protein